ncbi:acyltransferase [Runella rosea]|uniref:Acyltransferase n=1 Tax=Runella rosea TaxID=2259595 RepID=A0A344TEF3_9BACT|nr:acyltransferase [Runella rosea]AXE17024.1 acyltransferase [Runella rosea]
MDVKGIITYKAFYYYCNFSAYFYSVYTYIYCYFKGISIGNSNKFFGLPTIVRHPDSIISIASKCRFRSDNDSNLIGVSRKCILSTHKKYSKIIIGDNCGFSGTSIGCLIEIVIENNVIFGANTLVTDFDWHNLNPNMRSYPVETGKAVYIEENVFVGYGSIILKGVKIGKNSVIGANSVVTSDIPPNCIAAGNPCKVLSFFK